MFYFAIELIPITWIQARKNTKLHKAVQKPDVASVKTLLDQGYDCNAVGPQKNTPLHDAACLGHQVILEMLLKKGALPNRLNREKNTALYIAIYRDYKPLVPPLLEAGSDPNIKNIHGHTPLYWAASDGDLSLVNLLLKANANPNIQNNQHETPLYRAARFKRHAIIARLLEKGIDFTLKSNQTAPQLLTLDQIQAVKTQAITSTIQTLGLPPEATAAADLYLRISTQEAISLRFLSQNLPLPFEVLSLIFAYALGNQVFQQHPFLGEFSSTSLDIESLIGPITRLIENHDSQTTQLKREAMMSF